MAFLNNNIEAVIEFGGAARSGLFSMLIAAILLLSACVTIPIQEMSDARQAITGAEDVGAGRYAANSLNSAVKLMAMAEADLATKDYTHAREAANEAKSFALRARDLGGAFARVTAQMEQAAAIGAPVTGARQLVDDARRAAEDGDEDRADELLQRAGRQISDAQRQTYQSQARLLIDACATQEWTMSLPQQSTLTAARGALRDGDVARAYELAYGLAEEMGVLRGTSAAGSREDGD